VAGNRGSLGEHIVMMKKLSTFSLLVFVALVAPLQAFAQNQQPTSPPPDYYWPGHGHMWGYGGGFQFWWICPMMMLFMFLIFCIAFLFLRRSWADGSHHWGPPWHIMHGGPPTHSALHILNERFARGEIQKQEYEERKAIILSGARH